MRLGILVQGGEHDGQNGGGVVAYQRHDVLIVPVVEGSFGHLKMRRAHTLGELLEQGHLHFLKLDRLDHVEYLLELIQEHDLLGRVGLGPVLEQARDDLFGERRVLLEELHDTVGQLRMIGTEQLGLVQWQEHFDQKVLVLVLERQREPVDDAAEYLEELGDAIVSLCFVDESMKRVVYLLANVGSQTEELAVDAMQNRLEKVTLARVLAVEESQQLEQEPLIDELLGHVGLKVGRLEKAQEELVDDLKVRPRRLQVRLVLFGVELGAARIRGRRQRPEHVGRKHLDTLVVDGLAREHASRRRDVFDQLVQGLTLDLFGLEIAERLEGKVVADGTLTYLFQ